MTQRIYTRTGDHGETTLLGGARVPKTDAVAHACGELDELNAVLGLALTTVKSAEVRAVVAAVQSDLFILGAHVAASHRARRFEPVIPPLPERRIPEMEDWIDAAQPRLKPLYAFLLPGGTAAAANLHLARAVCRRAERSVATVRVNEGVPAYLNRLADLLFVAARVENYEADMTEVVWHRNGGMEPIGS